MLHYAIHLRSDASLRSWFVLGKQWCVINFVIGVKKGRLAEVFCDKQFVGTGFDLKLLNCRSNCTVRIKMSAVEKMCTFLFNLIF